MAYSDFKDLTKRTTFDKILHNRRLNIAKNPNYEGYQEGLASIIYKCFDKNFLVEQLKMRTGLIKN